MFKMSAIGFNTSYETHTPLTNGSIDDQLIKFIPSINNSLTEFFNVSDLCLVYLLLHYSPNFIINRI